MAISIVLKDNFKFYFAFKTTSVFSYFKHELLIYGDQYITLSIENKSEITVINCTGFVL